MNAQAILERIQEDAKTAASAILQDATDRAAALKQASEARIAAKREETLAQAEKDAGEAAERMKRMAELDQRKLLLGDKRRLMDRAFQQALEKLHQMPKDQAQALFMEKLLQAAAGGEQLVIGEIQPGWFDDAFLQQANAKLQAAGKEPLTALQSKSGLHCCGFLLRKGDMETDCSMEALLQGQRLALESQVAQVLFPQ